MREDFTAKRLTKEDLGLVQQVFDETRNTVTDSDFFVKKFISNSIKDFISVMYFDESKAIAHCAAIPFDFRQDESIKAALSGLQVIDAVTLPSYQRKGLFNSLNQEIKSVAEKDGFDLMFRFPSAINFKRVTDRFGFTHTENFQKFDFSFKTWLPLVKIFQRFQWDSLLSLYYKLLSLITLSSNSVFENSLKGQGYIYIPHPKSYFEYKTYSENFTLNVFGDKYWFKKGDGVIVGDLQVKSPTSFLRKLKVFCFLFGIHKISISVCAGTKEFEMLSQIGVPSEGFPICLKTLKPMDIEKVKFTFADLDTF